MSFLGGCSGVFVPLKISITSGSGLLPYLSHSLILSTVDLQQSEGYIGNGSVH